MTRTVIIGGPNTGKTTLARQLQKERNRGAASYSTLVWHTDDLIGVLDWSAISQKIADQWFARPCPWIIEGVAAVRALRKWLRAHAEGKPCDEIIVLERPWLALTDRQFAMAKGHETIWSEIEDELEHRGVELSRRS